MPKENKAAKKKFKDKPQDRGEKVTCVPLSGSHILGARASMTSMCGQRVSGWHYALPGYENEPYFTGPECPKCNELWKNR